jgi:cytoskeletal protein CcmA (bactofilin family)
MEDGRSGWARKQIRNGEAEPAAAAAGGGGGATFVDSGADFQGTLRLRQDFRIDGEFRGAIVSEGSVIVGEAAAIEANVHAREVVIGGAVVGNVVASRQLTLRAGARLHGDIETACLQVEKGAVFNGRTTMVRPEVAARAKARLANPDERPASRSRGSSLPAPAG